VEFHVKKRKKPFGSQVRPPEPSKIYARDQFGAAFNAKEAHRHRYHIEKGHIEKNIDKGHATSLMEALNSEASAMSSRRVKLFKMPMHHTTGGNKPQVLQPIGKRHVEIALNHEQKTKAVREPHGMPSAGNQSPLQQAVVNRSPLRTANSSRKDSIALDTTGTLKKTKMSQAVSTSFNTARNSNWTRPVRAQPALPNGSNTSSTRACQVQNHVQREVDETKAEDARQRQRQDDENRKNEQRDSALSGHYLSLHSEQP